jgi:hypothetical protein
MISILNDYKKNYHIEDKTHGYGFGQNFYLVVHLTTKS